MKLKDLKVKIYLFQAIDRTILKTILKKNTAKEIWDAMKKKYEGNARVRRSYLQALCREFEILEMKSGEGVTEYFSRVMIVANKMRTYGEDMQDVKVVEKILRSLTDNFNYIVSSIEESKDPNTLTIDELQSSLIVHEQKFQRRGGEEQALKVTNDEGRGRGSGSYRGRGRGTFNKANVQCFRCQKFGYFQYECSENKEANYAEFDEEEEMFLMSYEEKHGVQREDTWILDFGCSNHMCGDRSMFSDLNEDFRHSVKLGNNTRMNVMGKGNVKLLINGVNHVVAEVYYIPDLSSNLLSIGQLQEKGMSILIKRGECKIFHPKMDLIIQIKMSNSRMFTLQAQTQISWGIDKNRPKMGQIKTFRIDCKKVDI
ncbi:uncharacterized protein LOC105435094 [Cucumis sativus]|uniref:uncharacterized protein LOC105435094 n=1 Tax=Cucumis sativus TaxID=3659 RepID=UPI0012F49997|nr:uncharacterized protein LOC105435094 [Cucumis sativus]